MSKKQYDENSIVSLGYMEAIRTRPTMYIGSTGETGFLNLIREAIDNALDEAYAGYGDKITVSYDISTKEVIVTDNGRGIPVGKITDVMCKTHTGGKFNSTVYKYSRGMNGVGNKCINALSVNTTVIVCRDGYKWKQEFAKGEIKSPVTKIKAVKNTGTTIKFIPDIDIFHTLDLSYEEVLNELKISSYLNNYVEFKAIIKDNGETIKNVKYYAPNGLQDYMAELYKNYLLKNHISISAATKDMEVEILFNFQSKKDEETMVSFVNNSTTPEYGTHVTGFRMALTTVVTNHIDNNNMINKKDNIKITGDDIKEGLVCIVNMKHVNPEFEGQTKQKLKSTDALGFVRTVTTNALMNYFNDNPKDAKLICEKIIITAKSRLAAKRSKERSKRENTNLLNKISSLSKYSECESKNPDERELWIVEGKSGGGSVNEARDSRFQSKYALKGKPLNIFKNTTAKMLDNVEFTDLLSILNIKINKDGDIDISNLSYNHIIICADADADGYHINTLMTAFFLIVAPELVEQGYVYIAQPPLYKLIIDKKTLFIKDQKSYIKFLNNLIYEKYDFKLSKDGDLLTKKDLYNLLLKFDKIISNLTDLANSLSLSAEFIEEVIFNRKKDTEIFIAKMQKKFPEITATIKNNIVTFKGMYNDIYHLKSIDDTFLHEIEFLESLYKEAKTKYIYYKKKNDNKFKIKSAGSIFVQVQKEVTPKHKFRLKGIGEMNKEDLWDSTMNPDNRCILKITTKDLLKDKEFLADFLSDKTINVTRRKNYMIELSKLYNFDEIIEG